MKLKVTCGAVAVALTSMVVPTFADAVFTLGGNRQPSEENILYTTHPSGPTAFGFANQSNTKVHFFFDHRYAARDRKAAGKAHGNGWADQRPDDQSSGAYLRRSIFNSLKPADDNALTITVTMGDGSTVNFGPYGSTNDNNFPPHYHRQRSDQECHDRFGRGIPGFDVTANFVDLGDDAFPCTRAVVDAAAAQYRC